MILQYLIMIINNWVEILRNGSPICELVTGSPEFWLLKITFSYLLASYHAYPWKQTSLVISFNISTPHATSETRETPVETFHCDDVTLQDPCNVSIDCGHYAYLLGVSRLRNAALFFFRLCRKRGGVGDESRMCLYSSPLQCWKLGQYTRLSDCVYRVENGSEHFRGERGLSLERFFLERWLMFFLRIILHKHKENWVIPSFNIF